MLLGGGFQRQTFSFLCVPKLFPASELQFSTESNSRFRISYFMTGGLLSISSSWCQPLEAHAQRFSFATQSLRPECLCNISTTREGVVFSWVELLLWPTVSRPIRIGVGHPFGAHDQIFLFPFFCRTIALLFVLGRPLWREEGSVICSEIFQWSESRSTLNHTLLSHLRLLGSLLVASYDLQGLRTILVLLYSPGTDCTENVSYINACSLFAGKLPVP
jgi:hypothetical protein